MKDARPTESEVTIGRLRKRIVNLMEQRDWYKKQLEHYKVVVGGDWHIERRYPVKVDLSGNIAMAEGDSHEDAVNRYLRNKK